MIPSAAISAEDADLGGWIIQQGLTNQGDGTEVVAGVCERLIAIGIPLWRFFLAVPMVSPDLRAMNMRWHRDLGVEMQGVRHDEMDQFTSSPFWTMLEDKVQTRRWRLGSGEPPSGYAVIEKSCEQGGTDYLAHLVKFDETETLALRGAAFAFVSDAPGGFTDEEAARIARLVRLLGLTIFRVATSALLKDMLGRYVGRDAGDRVLRGEIRRGEGHQLSAALLFADLRGFTSVAETSGTGLVPRLGRHLAAMVEPVEAYGGEVLKFLGDGLLAAFALDAVRDPAEACSAALDAALDALARNALVNAGSPEERPLHLDVALHLGDVFYGNIGAGGRLDFTVIGPAVNEASRIESLCDVLGEPLLMSEPFARRCGRPVVSLGPHQLRGVSRPREVFTLPDA